MNSIHFYPSAYQEILNETKKINFSMASEAAVGCLLQTLAASKLKSKFLELGTGTGLLTAWILEGMDAFSTLKTVDYDADLLKIAHQFLDHDQRIEILWADVVEQIQIFKRNHETFDYIFADTWAGKYTEYCFIFIK